MNTETVVYVDTEVLREVPIADLFSLEKEAKELDLSTYSVGAKGFLLFSCKDNNRYCATFEIIEKTDKYTSLIIRQVSDSWIEENEITE